VSKAGKFEIEVQQGGYPVWCVIRYEGNRIATLHHNELSDLRHAVVKAEQEARNALPDALKCEVL
jgi:hypothetical protein